MDKGAWSAAPPAGVYGDLGERPDAPVVQLALAAAAAPSALKLKLVKLQTNSFRLVLGDTRSIYHYTYTLVPACDEQEHRLVLQHCDIWTELRNEFGPFVLRLKQHLFSPLPPKPGAGTGGFTRTAVVNGKTYTFSAKLHQTLSSDQVNSGLVGEAEVVFQHIVKSLFKIHMECQVGRRFFTNDVSTGSGTSGVRVFPGFLAAMGKLGGTAPRLTLDSCFQIMPTRNALETVCSAIELNEHKDLSDPHVQSVWTEHCVGRTVATPYNARVVYKIKCVRFDLTPQSTFMQRTRDQKDQNGRPAEQETTFVQYYEACYEKQIRELWQPLLEAYPERRGETVLLVPELCIITGFSGKDGTDKQETQQQKLQAAKIGPQDRHAIILQTIGTIVDSCAPQAAGQAATKSARCIEKLMQEWGMSVAEKPIEVEGRLYDPMQVIFDDKAKTFPIEDGCFTKVLRNGLKIPAVLREWLFIYPEADAPIIPPWMKSLKEMAQVAYHMTMNEPTKIQVKDQRNDLEAQLQKYVKPTTQLVIMLVPQKDCKVVYQHFKYLTTKAYPVVSQIVKSESVRRKTNIAVILSRIIVQINAKVAGALWHVEPMELSKSLSAPLFQQPTMAVGVDIYMKGGHRFLGFTASLNSSASEYYSVGCRLDAQAWPSQLCTKLQEYFLDACTAFLKWHNRMPPSHVLVYRGSTYQEEWVALTESELECFQVVLKALGTQCEGYDPTLTFVAVAKHSQARFFQVSEGKVKNAEVGTVVDAPELCAAQFRGAMAGFYLVNHQVTKGTAVPAHFAILHGSAAVSVEAVQYMTHRLAFMYFNSVGSVRLPAPLQYAKKLANFLATVFADSDEEPDRRLRRSFFYL